MSSSIGGRLVAILAAIPCALFGIITWSGFGSPLGVFLFGAAIVLLMIGLTGQNAASDGGIVPLLAAVLLGYAGLQLVAFAASEYRKSARMVDSGNDFAIQGIIAGAGVALMLVGSWIVVRRDRK